jgi:transposase
MAELFWLNDKQWAVIEPLLPHLGGKPRVDDRRVISGILHRFREGLRWRAMPDEYGPRTTLFNRFNRWSRRGLWQELFAALAACGDPPILAMVDSTSVKVHRSASGAKGGSTTKPSAGRAAVAPRKSTRSAISSAGSTLCS